MHPCGMPIDSSPRMRFARRVSFPLSSACCGSATCWLSPKPIARTRLRRRRGAFRVAGPFGATAQRRGRESPHVLVLEQFLGPAFSGSSRFLVCRDGRLSCGSRGRLGVDLAIGRDELRPGGDAVLAAMARRDMPGHTGASSATPVDRLTVAIGNFKWAADDVGRIHVVGRRAMGRHDRGGGAFALGGSAGRPPALAP